MKKTFTSAAVLCLASLAAVQAADPNTLTPAEREKGWRLLFDGKTTHGWAPNTSGAATPQWKAINGALVPPEGPVCWYVSTTKLDAYDVTGECLAEKKTDVMLGIAESNQETGKPVEYSSTLVLSSGPTAAGKWTGFRLSVRPGKAAVAWDGQGSPEKKTFDPRPTHFQLGYFGPGKVQFRNLKLLPVK